jgi:hypothetical protein
MSRGFIGIVRVPEDEYFGDEVEGLHTDLGHQVTVLICFPDDGADLAPPLFTVSLCFRESFGLVSVAQIDPFSAQRRSSNRK